MIYIYIYIYIYIPDPLIKLTVTQNNTIHVHDVWLLTGLDFGAVQSGWWVAQTDQCERCVEMTLLVNFSSAFEKQKQKTKKQREGFHTRSKWGTRWRWNLRNVGIQNKGQYIAYFSRFLFVRITWVPSHGKHLRSWGNPYSRGCGCGHVTFGLAESLRPLL